MLIEPKSRFFQQYDIQIRAARHRGEPLRMMAAGEELDVITALRGAIGREHGVLALSSNDECRLTAVTPSEDQKYIALLFRRSSPDASTPFFGHRRTGRLRKAEKEVDEDLSISSHLFIDTTYDERRTHRYRAILEEVPGIGRTYIQSILDRAIRITKYTYRDENGCHRETYSKCELNGYKSSFLGSAIEQGSIPYVELIRKETIEGLDSSDFIAGEQRQRILVQASGSVLMDKLTTLRQWATGRGWDDMRVQIRLPEGRARVVSISREDDAASILFVRSEQVYVERDLDVCRETVDSQLFEHAIEMFGREWSANVG